MRIEAAAYRGKPVYFELIGPWTRPERMQPYQPTAGERAASVIVIVLLLSLLVGGAMLARRNLRLGRGDRRGAFRLAAFVFAAWAVAWFFGAHHVPNFDEFGLFIEFLSFGLALLLFLLGSLHCLGALCAPPLARHAGLLEPLAGGRLSGSTGGTRCAGRLSFGGVFDRSRKTGMVCSLVARLSSATAIFGSAVAVSGRAYDHCFDISNRVILALFISLAFLFVLFLLRALLRKEWAAAIACVLLFTVFYAPANRSHFAPVVLVTGLISLALTVFLLIRFGLLAVVAAGVFNDLLGSFPLTTQGSAWYAGISLAGILLMAAMAFYGFYTSLGGRPVFGGAVLEE